MVIGVPGRLGSQVLPQVGHHVGLELGLGATVWIYRQVPTGFIPQEDQGYLIGIVQAPPGSSLAYTSALSQRAQAIIYSNKDISGAFSIMGFSFSGGSSNAGLMFISTKPALQRQEMRAV